MIVPMPSERVAPKWEHRSPDRVNAGRPLAPTGQCSGASHSLVSE